jgi:hypothetical protein
MLRSAAVLIVDFCARHAWPVVIAGVLVALATTAYDVTRFSITMSSRLFRATFPGTGASSPSSKKFPQYGTPAVVRAPTPEFSEQAKASS